MKIQKYLKPPPTVNFGEGSTPPKFNSEFTSEKWWLEDDPYLLGRELFRGDVKPSGGYTMLLQIDSWKWEASLSN